MQVREPRRRAAVLAAIAITIRHVLLQPHVAGVVILAHLLSLEYVEGIRGQALGVARKHDPWAAPVSNAAGAIEPRLESRSSKLVRSPLAWRRYWYA